MKAGIVRTKSKLSTRILKSDNLYERYSFEKGGFDGEILLGTTTIETILNKTFTDIDNKQKILDILKFIKENFSEFSESSSYNFILVNDTVRNKINLHYGSKSLLKEIVENYDDIKKYLNSLKYNIGEIHFFEE